MERTYDTNGRELIREYLKDCKSIADLGCNEHKIIPEATGYDIDMEVNPDVRINLIKSPVVFEKEHDAICMSHFLEHVVKLRAFLLNLYNLLPDNGKIAIIVPDGEDTTPETLGDSTNTHEQLFTPKTLKLFLQNAGFKEVETKYYERPYAYKQTKGIFACGVKYGKPK